MKPTVYIETTIPSFLTARPSNNLIVAGKQEVTRQWWEMRREKYELFVSELVFDEALKGDIDAAERRIAAIEGIPSLEIDNEVIRITERIIEAGVIPEKSASDAAHIAVASRHGVDYLMTWNCTHIANAEIIGKMSFLVAETGHYLPIICTPDELFGGQEDD